MSEEIMFQFVSRTFKQVRVSLGSFGRQLHA